MAMATNPTLIATCTATPDALSRSARARSIQNRPKP
jgi:hypothetical protein